MASSGMTFRFKRRETIAGAFARIVAEQIAHAIMAAEEPEADAIHEVRTSIKRVRALLRLFERALPAEAFARESEELRTCAARFAPARDAHVQQAAFSAIAYGLAGGPVEKLRAEFAADASRAERPRGAEITAALRAVRDRLAKLKVEAAWPLIGRGVKRAYRRARKAHAAARAELSTAAFHEWRRRSKDFHYQVQLLRKADPGDLKKLVRRTAKLADLLGDEHDLAVLDARLARLRAIPAELRGKLRARIARRRQALQRKAFALGSKVFFEKPSDFAREIGRKWKHWHRGYEPAD